MENQELFLLEIDEFNRSSHHNDPKLTQNLDNFIEYVAKTGVYLFPWHKIKKLYIVKMESVIDHFNHISNMDVLSPIPNFEHVKFNELKDRLSERMNSFTSAPFTIQRISELLMKPQLNYSRTDKYLRGLEKCVMVVTTVDPDGNKIFIDLPVSNGLGPNETNANCASDHDKFQLLTLLNLPPPQPQHVIQTDSTETTNNDTTTTKDDDTASIQQLQQEQFSTVVQDNSNESHNMPGNNEHVDNFP